MDVKVRSFPDFDYFLAEISTAQNLERLSSIISEMRIAYDLAHIVYHAVHIPGDAPANPILLPTYILPAPSDACRYNRRRRSLRLSPRPRDRLA